MADAVRKQNDNRDTWMVVLKHGPIGAQTPIDLSTASSVRFIMRSTGLSDADPPKVNGLMTITDAINGVVTYQWTGTDLDTVDTYNIEHEIHWADGGIKTIPDKSDGIAYLTLEVVDDLG